MYSLKPLANIIKGRPVLAIFEICLRCNSACGYCDLPLNEGRSELTREEIKIIFADLYATGVRFLFIQGGEPTVRRDLIEILHDLHEIGFRLTLITNGTRLSEKMIAKLSELPISISISLDTLDREHYKSIRGADQLPQVLDGIVRLANYPHPKFITCIVTEQNRKDVTEVVEYSRKKGFMPVVGAYHWGIERYGRVDPTLQYQRDAAVEIFKNLMSDGLIPKGYFRNYLQDNIDWLSGKDLSSCDAGRYSISIDSSGNVAPCLALQHAGNLLENSLTEILDNFDQQSIDDCSNNSSCNMMCSRVVGSIMKKPFSSLRTPKKLNSITEA
jgi:MoaA/NifB/PqqE/SkfB family radical SAM enzyme